ncbi:MAG: hypothetical protein DRI88_06430 [Bacteroidetes bacterium]|nr:MAG: hypothetical protein DRI72_03895 [Bacteroidota bacterium]RLD47211.1 MAG: hypothetical protein DRI88_06430 [Bacteroidota bacterium]RLD72741.1 MAG: hypothetical protein DRI87_05350 [Bacteroidota bacterium]RLD85779.1 MAG: hypothetical protein DRJ02_09770 [Bacteroidota bacterium]
MGGFLYFRGFVNFDFFIAKNYLLNLIFLPENSNLELSGFLGGDHRGRPNTRVFEGGTTETRSVGKRKASGQMGVK